MFIFSYFASYLPFFVAARYRTPLIPFLLLFGAIGVIQLIKFIKNGKWVKLIFWVGTVFCIYMVANINIAGYKVLEHRWHDDRGIAYENQDKLSEAIEEYEKAIRIAPNDASAHKNLGNVLERVDKPNRAITHYLRALKINPYYDEAYLGLASVYLENEKLYLANKNIKKALEINPNSPFANELMKYKNSQRPKNTGI